jgi:hypothetical protein
MDLLDYAVRKIYGTIEIFIYTCARSQQLFLHVKPKKQPPRTTQKPSPPCWLFAFINKSTLLVQFLSCYIVDGDMDIQICYTCPKCFQAHTNFP